jgi:hypothetical protein
MPVEVIFEVSLAKSSNHAALSASDRAATVLFHLKVIVE